MSSKLIYAHIASIALTASILFWYFPYFRFPDANTINRFHFLLKHLDISTGCLIIVALFVANTLVVVKKYLSKSSYNQIYLLALLPVIPFVPDGVFSVISLVIASLVLGFVGLLAVFFRFG